MTEDPFERLAEQAAARRAVLQQEDESIDAVFDRLAQHRSDFATDIGEMNRILALPMIDLTPEQHEAISRRMILAEHFDKGFRLLTTQSSALYAFDMVNGGFYPIGVGWGKGGISVLIAEIGYRHKEMTKVLLFVPASVYSQTMDSVVPMWRKKSGLSIPVIGLGQRSAEARMRLAKSGRPGLYVYPYSLLSRSDSLSIMAAISPKLIIADEAHMLKNRVGAGRTKKFLLYMKACADHGCPPAFVAMSGTMSTKGISDYHHLIDLALADKSPLPRQGSLAYFWGQLLDSGAEVTEDSPVETLLPLMRWAMAEFPEEDLDPMKVSDLRKAFRLRLTSAPGVVSTGDVEIPNSLVIRNLPIPETQCPQSEGWDELLKLIHQVDHAWLTPDGDEISCALHRFKWFNELAGGGIYNSFYWPTVEHISEKKGVSLETAAEALEQAKLHHAAMQLYNKHLRAFIKSAPAGLDTPMEVARAINQKPELMPDSLVELYQDTVDQEEVSKNRFGFLVERLRKIVRVCDFKIQGAVRWAKEHKRGIIWCSHRGVAAWAREIFTEEGLDPVFAPQGANEVIQKLGDPDLGGKGDRICIASIRAHHQGKNLQAFDRSFYLEWHRNAVFAEQSLGRTHRTGQAADEVLAFTQHTMPFDYVNFAASLNDAVAIHQTMGRQKLVYADYDPMPKTFSPEFLREQGADPKKLTEEQRGMLEDRFGRNWERKI